MEGNSSLFLLLFVWDMISLFSPGCPETQRFTAPASQVLECNSSFLFKRLFRYKKTQGLKFLLYLSVRTQVKSNDLGHSHFCPSTFFPHWLHIDLGLFSATPRGLDDSTWSSIQFVCSPGLPLWQWSLVPLSSDLKLPSLLMFQVTVHLEPGYVISSHPCFSMTWI